MMKPISKFIYLVFFFLKGFISSLYYLHLFYIYIFQTKTPCLKFIIFLKKDNISLSLSLLLLLFGEN